MLIFFLFLSFVFTIFYVSIMLTYKNEWNDLEEIHFLNENPTTSVTVIIPARNEAKNIGHLLNDIMQQVFPENLLEVIIIDENQLRHIFFRCATWLVEYDFYAGCIRPNDHCFSLYSIPFSLEGLEPKMAYSKSFVNQLF